MTTTHTHEVRWAEHLALDLVELQRDERVRHRAMVEADPFARPLLELLWRKARVRLDDQWIAFYESCDALARGGAGATARALLDGARARMEVAIDLASAAILSGPAPRPTGGPR